MYNTFKVYYYFSFTLILLWLKPLSSLFSLVTLVQWLGGMELPLATPLNICATFSKYNF